MKDVVWVIVVSTVIAGAVVGLAALMAPSCGAEAGSTSSLAGELVFR